MKFRLFISSVQKEFAKERRAIANYIRNDTVLRSPNELIATPMYLKGYIEKMGTGTEDVAKLCAKNGLSAPAFAEGVDFRAVLKRKPLVGIATSGAQINVPASGTIGGLNATRELTEKLTEKLTETEQKIVAAIMENGRITQGVLARKIGVARTYVTKLMGGLQSKSVIRRVGPDKGGYWEVVGIGE